MSDGPGTAQQPLRVAIIGSGPAGFYAADHLLRAEGVTVEVDMLDRLPTPYGLVRGGVAPDHPKLKSVTRIYDKTAGLPGFRFYGNVELGRDVTREDLVERYHAIIYAIGSETDRRLEIPGEDLPGSASATAFVGWYNGHPDYRELEFDLSGERAVVIGNGNVAADVTRMLALSVDELAGTDVADHALEALRHSRIREIVVLGRRGPGQAAFTNPELRELGELDEADVDVDPRELEIDEASRSAMSGDRRAERNLEILRGYAETPPRGRPKRIVLRFGRSPVEIHGPDRVQGITVCHNEIVADETGTPRSRPTERIERIDCDLVLRSIGYRGVALPGVPFDDDRGVMPNDAGRLLDRTGGKPVLGEYAAGWIKRGPTGIIGTNKRDARETVDRLLADLEAGHVLSPTEPDREAIESLLSGRRPDFVSYEGWELIDAHEQELGRPQNRPRVKLTTVDELVDVGSAERLAKRS